MRTVLDARDCLIHHSQVHFVHQRRRLQRGHRFASQLGLRYLAQLIVDRRQQCIDGNGVATTVTLQQLGERSFRTHVFGTATTTIRAAV